MDHIKRLSSIVVGYVRQARTAPLYHGTTLNKALSIIQMSELKGNLHTHPNEWDVYKQSGVSLTRDKWFVDRWAEVIFVIDQDKLSRRHQIIPRDFSHMVPDDYDGEVSHREESEEFVPGSIPNLDRYLISIQFSSYGLKQLSKVNPENYRQRLSIPLGALKTVMDHPKFSVWQREQLPYRLVYDDTGRVVVEDKFPNRPVTHTLDDSIPF